MTRLAPFAFVALSFGVVGFPNDVHAQIAVTGDNVTEVCGPDGSEMFCIGIFTTASQFLMAGCAQAHHFGHRADLVEANLSGVSALELQAEFLHRMTDPVFYAVFADKEAVFGIGIAAGERWPC